MNQSNFPNGWEDERVKKVIAHYDSLKDEEVAAKDDAAFAEEGFTMMSIPNELVDQIRALIARYGHAG